MQQAVARRAIASMALAAAACRNPAPHEAPTPLASSRREASAPLQPAATVVRAPARHQIKSRPWRLAPASPLHLVAEGLRDASVHRVGAATVVRSTPCAADTTPGAALSLRFSLRSVDGDSFGTALASSPPIVSRPHGLKVAGTWPANLFVLLPYARNSEPFGPRDEAALLQWDGKNWGEILAPEARRRASFSVPSDVLDWDDRSALVVQSVPRSAGAPVVEPFLALGQRTRPVPNFSSVSFPKPLGTPLISIKFAALSTHEIFLLHEAQLANGQQTVVSLARSSAVAEGISLETVLSTPGHSHVELASGKLGDKEVMVVWGETSRAGSSKPLLRVYDATSQLHFDRALDVPASSDTVQRAWLGGGKLWLQRGRRVTSFDGHAWKPFATLPEVGQELYAVPNSDTSWTIQGTKLLQYDAGGRATEIPFLVGTENLPRPQLLVPIDKGDVWVVAMTPERESLLFRTKPMKEVIACD